MNPIDPIELSAYLDDELAPSRKQEIKTALAMNAHLSAELSALAQADTAWRAAACSAAFVPKVQLPQGVNLTRSSLASLAVLALLIAVWIVPKLSDILALGFVLHALALVTCLIWINHMVEERSALPN